jgi:predicted ATP-binding protein involved in virulence
MHIEQLTLNQFRGAKHLSLVLHDRMNVFVGMNGAGKSSLLDASAILLSWLINRIKSASASGRPIIETDIQNGSGHAALSLRISNYATTYEWSLVKYRKGRHQDEKSSLQSLSELAAALKKRFSACDGVVNLPLFVYYPVNRAVLDIPLRIRDKHRFDVLSAYDDALTGGSNFRTFFEWFREREDLENENRKYSDQLVKPEGYQFPDPQLQAVRSALGKFMPEFSNLTVRRNPLRMEVEKGGKRLTVNQLSDGEKCMMAMVGDLARRLAIINPICDNPLDGEGIILIDEIDLHLHPKWQRMIIIKLREVFPNCQFLLSTHSPHVITHAQPENIYLLSMQSDLGMVCDQPSESYGKTVERILEDLMGLETTRPDEVSEALGLIYQHIDEGRLDQAKTSITELQSRIGSDPDLIKATVLIKRKELIGK